MGWVDREGGEEKGKRRDPGTRISIAGREVFI